MNNIAFIFSGQGSQTNKIFEDFVQKSNIFRDTIKKIQNHIDIDLINAGTELGRKQTNCTWIAQPTIFAKQVGIVDILKKEFNIIPNISMGMSLGQYASMYASNFSDLETLSEMVNMRANLMSIDVKNGNSEMIAVISLEMGKVFNIYKDLELRKVYVSNDNSNKQIVFSGNPKEIEILTDNIKKYTNSTVIALNTEGAFHTPFFNNSAVKFENYLKKYGIFKSSIPIIDNLTGSVTYKLSPENLGKQISNTVLWKKSVDTLNQIMPNIVVEIGSGSPLKKLTKISNAKYFSIEEYSDIYKLNDYLNKVC